MTKIDWTKPVQTKDGREVRVLCTDMRVQGFGTLVHGLIINPSSDVPAEWKQDGTPLPGFSYNTAAINVPEKRYVNLYWDTNTKKITSGQTYISKDDAERYSAHITPQPLVFVGFEFSVPAGD